ncbi:MAG: DUF4491 family protein [Lentisphaeria bacterium]|jgi:uncharacterized membrane protein YuzA (DUF378 family)|nr:DUF4491 family protein [Lentisphaeria bacterium]MDY0177434.1 DUF4491 family protein [Lentisphaeria bacterium]NLZ61012.1 DUF4491 family protein [Lentisphaerota bacterium]
MYFQGLFSGLVAFLIIGLFHPLVIKGEYYFGAKIWPAFLLLGLACCAAALFLGKMPMLSSILGIVGFSAFWSIHEIIEQEKRVAKGWFPKNPKRKQAEP